MYFNVAGVYLPLLWEQPSFCSRSPIALGYTRGHFCALIPPEPTSSDSVSGGNVSSGAFAAVGECDERAALLPLVSADKQLLPVHFLTTAESERTESILGSWLNVGMTDGGILVARQRIEKPPLLVAQLTEEWLNHYRKLA